jgi:hypothetical protein
MMNYEKDVQSGGKLEWRSPEVRRFAAGSAESQRGATPDGGGGNQGS